MTGIVSLICIEKGWHDSHWHWQPWEYKINKKTNWGENGGLLVSQLKNLSDIIKYSSLNEELICMIEYGLDRMSYNGPNSCGNTLTTE